LLKPDFFHNRPLVGENRFLPIVMVSESTALGPSRQVLLRAFECNDKNFLITGFLLS